MKICRINNLQNINFRNAAVQNKPSIYEPNQNQTVTSSPIGFINPKIPMGYNKINEFNLPNTDTKVHIYKLANGQKVVLVPQKGKTQINTYVNCGSMNETDEIRGISHFIEHNLFNGSEKIKPKELFGTINKMGSYTNAWTSEFATSYTIQSHLFDSEDLPKIIELHADMIQHPKFEQAQLDKEKGVVNSEITMYDDNNPRRLISKAYKQLFQLQTEANDLVGGTVKNINNLTRDDVISYYNKNYTPDKMTTILTGEFDTNEAIELISKNFTKQALPSTTHYEKLTPIEKSVRSDYFSPLIQNDEYVLSLKGPDNNNLKDTICTQFIISMLSGAKHSRLDKNLRPFNTNSELILENASNNPYAPQIISLFASSNPKNTEQVLKTIYSTIHNMRNENLSEDIDIVKKSMQKSLLEYFETGDRINAFLGDYLKNYSPEEIQKLPEIINSITEKDIKETLVKYFDMNKVSLVVSHPQNAEPPAPENKISFKGKLKKTGLNINEFKFAKLPNNAQVYLKDDSSSLKHFTLDINTDIPANVSPVLSLVFTQMLSKGSILKSQEDFSKDLAKKGAAIDINTDAKGITISGSALNEDIDFALSKAIEILKNPKITQETLDEIKKQIEKEILDEIPSPKNYISKIMFPQIKSEISKEEKLQSLKDITLGDILGLCEYLKQNSSLYFIWNKKDVPYSLNELGQFKPTQNQKFNTYIPLEKDVLKTQVYNAGQANITKSFKYLHNGTPKEYANIKLLNLIFGGGQSSRLFMDLRETQKLAYSTGSSTEKYGNTGILTMRIGTTTDNPQDSTATSANITKSIEGFNRNIEKIKNEPVTKEELESAKLSAKSHILNSVETNSNKMDSFLDSTINNNNPNFLNEVLEAIDKVTIEDIQKTAQKVFEGHSLTSIVAGEKTLKELNLLQ